MPTYLEAYRAARAASQQRPGSSDSGSSQGSDKKPSPVSPVTKAKDAKSSPATSKPTTPKSTPSKNIPAKQAAAKSPTKPTIDIGKQKGAYDTKAVRTQVHKWQALAADAAGEGGVANKANKLTKPNPNGTTPPASPIKATTGADYLVKEVKKNTPPKKRVVSDEHWKKKKDEPSLTDSPRVIKAKALGFETRLYLAADGSSPEGFVRRRAIPPKDVDLPVKKLRDSSAPANLDRSGGPKTGMRSASARDKAREIDARLQTVNEKDESPERPKSNPEKESMALAQDYFKNAYVRKSRKFSDNKAQKSDESPSPGSAPAISNPMRSRMEAWLSQTPDPFIEDLSDIDAEPGRPQSVGDLGSLLAPRATHVRDRRQSRREVYDDSQSESDFDGNQGGTLKRRGARRGAHSPRAQSSPRAGGKDTSGALQLAPVSKSPARPGIKRNMASHADLMSVLSLGADEGKGLVPARSMRTPRARPDNATIPGLLDEIRSDEIKYARDLRTLVDGVVPVLLNSVLSGSNGQDLAGAVNNLSCTKDTIVDLGIALERLQSSHRRVPTNDTRSLLAWAQRSHQVYADYISAWSMDFKDIMINLAPNNDPTAAGQIQSQGDGERVDVSFLLKRPLVRLKYLAKTITGIDQLEPSAEAAKWAAKYQDLVDDARIKQDFERARREDEAAAAIDNTRSRDPETLAPISGQPVRTDRCVRARDIFDLHMDHSSGQKLDCRVMLFLRDDKSGGPGGDVLICQIEDSSRWLLFPPAELGRLSARLGESDNEIVVMIRGVSATHTDGWRELLSLTSDNPKVATEWLKMLGTRPVPPMTIASRDAVPERPLNPRVVDWIGSVPMPGEPGISFSDIDVPLGEQSVISSQIIDDSPRRPRDRTTSRKVKFEDRTPPASVGYAAKAKDNFKNLFSDLKTAKIIPGGQSDRQRSIDPYRMPPDRPSFHRPLSPILSESIPINPVPPAGDPSPVAIDGRQTPVLSPSTPTEKLPMSRQRYRGRGQGNSASRSPSPSPSTPNKPSTATPQNAVHLRGASSPLASTTPNSNTRRRSSSPLKYEYEPSTPSDASPAASDADQDDAGSVTSESSIDDLVPDPYPGLSISKPGGKRARSKLPYSPNDPGTVAPSQSASQVADGTDQQERPNGVSKTVASIFAWSEKGTWKPLHANECSIVVSPGLIEAFRMSAAHSLPLEGDISAALEELREIERPLVALELTPLVPLRQGTAIDISIRSPPTANSQIRTSNNIMFRSRSGAECDALYSMINQARIHNPRYIALQNARGPMGGGGGWGSFMDRQASARGTSGWWKLGSRRGSYRASSKRNTASVAETRTSVGSMSSALLNRFTGSKMFNVARSTITSRVGGTNSNSRSSASFTGSSGSSTPITVDPSKGTPAGMTDMKIRIYEREDASKWRDMGAARLTIMHPPRPTAEMITPTGHLKQEKRVIVVGKSKGETILDVTLGETSFERVARTGIAVKIWEHAQEIGKTGGVLTATLRVFMIQLKSEAEAAYTFSLVGRQRY